MPITCSANLFDGTSPVPHEVTVSIAGDRFTCRRPGAREALRIPPERILHYDQLGEECHLELAASSAAAASLKLVVADPAFNAELEAYVALADPRTGAAISRGLRRIPLWAWFVIAVVAFPTIYVVLTRTFVAAHTLISVEKEAALGEAVFEQLSKQFAVCESEELHDELQAIVAELADPMSPYKCRVTVFESPDINAFALPGGRIIILSGLLGIGESADSVIGVLAHEVAHVERRHSLKHILRAMGVLYFMSAAVGGGFEDLELVETASELSGLLLVLEHSRDAEREADEIAVRKLHAARRSVGGMIRFFEAVEKKAGQLPEALLWISTHPMTSERLDMFNKTLAQETFDPRPWRLVREAWARVATSCAVEMDEVDLRELEADDR